MVAPKRQIPDLSSEAVEANALAALRRPTELIPLGVLLAAYALIFVLNVSALHESMNFAGPVALTLILGWSCYRIVSQSPVAVWAPLFWFRLACAVYFGFGALVPHIVNEETKQHILNLYSFDDALNFKVNLICVAGIFLTLAFSLLFLSRRSAIRTPRHAKVSLRKASRGLLAFALCFLVVGGILRYGFVVPYTFGLTQTVLPGIVGTLSNMYYAGVFLLISYVVVYNKKIAPIALVLVAFEIVVSIASFAKTELTLILIFSFLGFISRDAGKVKLLAGVSCVVVAFLSFQSLVGYGRDQILMRYGEIRGAGLQERWDIVRDYLDGGHETVASARQGGLSRLSYVNVNALVVDRYDAGIPGNTFRNAAAVLVPRMLWPDKPIITQLGADLNILVFGRDGSQLGLGHFAEAYWNFGWGGIAPFMAVLSLILSLFTKISISIIARREWLFLPVVFVGVDIGLRVDGHFVSDILGATWIAICLGVALMTVNMAIKRPARQQRQLS